MPVAAVGTKPAVIVDYAPVYFRIDFTFPTTYTLITVMNNQVYVLTIPATVHVDAAPRAVQVVGM
jgi:hypothetical protein